MATNGPKDLRKRIDWPVASTLAWILTACLLALRWVHVREGIWVDSDVYVMGARAILQGQDPYAVVSERDLPFTYSPFAAACFIPLAVLPVAAGRIVLTAVSAISYVAVASVAGRSLSLPSWKIALVGALGLALEPMLRTLLLGQINLTLAALVVLDLLVIPKRWRGWLIGAAAGIKIVPGVFSLFFLLRRDWIAGARSGLGFLATAGLGWFVAPEASLAYWGGGFFSLGKFGDAAIMGSDNQSMLAVWMRMTGDPNAGMAVKLLFMAVGVGLGVGAARVCLLRLGRGSDVRAIACLALGALLGSPISWSHHWVWIVVVLLVAAADRHVTGIVLIALVMFVAMFWGFYEGDAFRLPNSLGEHVAAGSYVFLAPFLLIMVASARPVLLEPTFKKPASGRESLVKRRNDEELIDEPPLPS